MHIAQFKRCLSQHLPKLHKLPAGRDSKLIRPHLPQLLQHLPHHIARPVQVHEFIGRIDSYM